MRAILRRRIDDPRPTSGTDVTQWIDAELDEILNVAAADVEAAIKAVDPEAFIRVTRTNIVANDPLVPKPQGAGAILDVKQLVGVNYVTLGDPVRYDQVPEFPTSGTILRYALLGRWIYLAPTPSANVTNGLEWWFSESVEIPTGAANDNTIFPFDTALHDAVVYKAELVLGPEQDGPPDQGVALLYQQALAKIPTYYRRTLGRPTPFSPALVKQGQR